MDASTYYSVLHPDEMKLDWAAFYRRADAATAAARTVLRHELDLAYGPALKQRLDLYFPSRSTGPAPVFLFLHGGGFREGDRAQYGYVAEPLAGRGVITAVASYRLTGEGFRYPTQGEDARLALEWLYRNVQRFGGDAQRLYVGGHSCGAIMAADLGVDRGWMTERGIPRHVLRGIVGVSAPYDLRTPGDPDTEAVFWGRYVATPELRERASPLLNIVDPVPAVLLAAGSTENVGYDDYAASSRQFAARLSEAGSDASYLSVEGANHQDTVLALGQADSELSLRVARMIGA